MAEFGFEFENWAGTTDFRPRRVFAPASAADVATAIRTANSQNRRIRVCGSAWSYSGVQVSHDYVMDLFRMNAILGLASAGQLWGHPGPVNSPPLGPPTALLPSVASSSRCFAHVQAGIVLRDLIVALDSPGADSGPTSRGRWALPTMGGSAGQTLAGVISTSSHGGDFTLPPVADMVRAIDLIAADGSRHWFEPASPASITDPAALTAVFADGPMPPVLHYDDDQFNAVLVSMGCMGVIQSMIIEVVPQFGVSQRVGTSTWNTVKGLITSGALFTSLPPWPGVKIDPHPPIRTTPGRPAEPTPRGMEIFVNPYRKSDDYQSDPAPDRDCIVVSRAVSPSFDAPLAAGWCPGLPLSEQLVIINGFKAGTAKAARLAIDAVIAASRCPTTGYPAAWSVTDTYGANPWAVSNPDGAGRGPVDSIEFAVSNIGGADVAFVDAMLAAVDAILAGNLDAKLAGAFSLRYTLTSQALLAIQNFAPYPAGPPPLVCHVEVPCYKHVDGVGNVLHQDEDPIGGRNPFEMESSSAEHVVAFEKIASASGVHLHWGMMSLTGSHHPASYIGFGTWQEVRHDLAKIAAGPSENRAFENDFTIRYRISAAAAGWDVVGESLLPGSPTDTPAAAETVVNGIIDASAGFPPAAFRNPRGHIEVLAINPDGNVCWNMQVTRNASLTQPMADFFSWNWVQQEDPSSTGSVLHVRFAGRLAVGFNRGNGHPEVFALNLDDGKIHHAWRDQFSDRTWQSWRALDGDDTFVSSPDVAMGGNDNLVVVARRADGRICRRDQNSVLGVIGWNGWSALAAAPAGVVFAGGPCLGRNSDGTLEVFTRDTGGLVWRAVQAEPKSDAEWSGWTQIGSAPVACDPAVGHNPGAGTLELFASGGGPGLLHLPQSAPGSWAGAGDWRRVPAPGELALSARPSVTVKGPNLQVCALLADGDVVHYDQNGGRWLVHLLPCSSARGDLFATSAPALAVNDDGRLEVFVKTVNDMVQHVAQNAIGRWPLTP